MSKDIGTLEMDNRIPKYLPPREMADRAAMLDLFLAAGLMVRESGLDDIDVTVWMCVAIGYYRGQPTTIHDVVRLTRLPVSSVSRHLDRLRGQDLIKSVTIGKRRLHTLTATALEHPAVDPFFSNYRPLILKTADALRMGVKPPVAYGQGTVA